MKRVLLSVAFALYGVAFVTALSQDAGLVKINSTVNKPCRQNSDCNSHYYNDRFNKTSLEYCVQNKCRCESATVFENQVCFMSVGSPCGADFPSCERNSECRPWSKGFIQRRKCMDGFFQNADKKCVHEFEESCKIDADCDFVSQKLRCSSKGKCDCASDQIYDKDSKQCKARLRGVCQTGSDERNILRCLDGLDCIRERTKCTSNCVGEMRCLGKPGTACTLLQDSCAPGLICKVDNEGSVFGICTNSFIELLETIEIAVIVFFVALFSLYIWINEFYGKCCCTLPVFGEAEPKPNTPAVVPATTPVTAPATTSATTATTVV